MARLPEAKIGLGMLGAHRPGGSVSVVGEFRKGGSCGTTSLRPPLRKALRSREQLEIGPRKWIPRIFLKMPRRTCPQTRPQPYFSPRFGIQPIGKSPSCPLPRLYTGLIQCIEIL